MQTSCNAPTLASKLIDEIHIAILFQELKVTDEVKSLPDVPFPSR